MKDGPTLTAGLSLALELGSGFGGSGVSRTLQVQPPSWRLMLEHYLARPRVAKHNVARSVWPSLDELQSRVFRHTGEQRPAASEEDRTDNDLILVDQAVLRELRHDGAATKDNHVFAGPALHGLDLARVEFVKNAGILPRHTLQAPREDQFCHLV